MEHTIELVDQQKGPAHQRGFSLKLRPSATGKVTDAVVERVTAVTKLEALAFLDLSYTDITNNALKLLEACEGLRMLNLSYCHDITDAGLTHLRGLISLEVLYLHDIGDAGLVHLEGLPSLSRLSIASPRVTSVGLESLRKMKQLKLVSLVKNQRHIHPIAIARFTGDTSVLLEYTQANTPQ